jgi:Tfp pilus assembly protein FimT
MTLLELMLVLALLVVIGSLTLPAFQVPFENQRLRKAGEVVRVQWNKARNKAMRTGQIQMFRLEVGAGTFQIMPYYTEQDYLEADATRAPAAAGATAAFSRSAAQFDDQAMAVPQTLPDGVVFTHCEVKSDMRALQIQQDMQGTQVPIASPSLPILFFPDGTTSDARVVLTNQYQKLFLAVSLRGLTGTAKASHLVTVDELQQIP